MIFPAVNIQTFLTNIHSSIVLGTLLLLQLVRAFDQRHYTAIACPCLSANLCPSSSASPPAAPFWSPQPFGSPSTNSLSACWLPDQIRCCDVLTRGFIGMFGNPEVPADEQQQRVIESATPTVDAVLQEIWQQNEYEVATAAGSPMSTEPQDVDSIFAMTTITAFPDQTTTTGSDGVGDQTETTTDSGFITTTEGSDETTTAIADLEPTTTIMPESSTTTTSPPPTTTPVVTSTTTTTTTTTTTPKPIAASRRPKFAYIDSAATRKRFRPSSTSAVSFSRNDFSDRTRPTPTTTLPTLTTTTGVTTTVPPPTDGMPLKNKIARRRQTLFSSGNRINVLRMQKKTVVATTSAPLTSVDVVQAETTPSTPPSPSNVVDSEHRVMIEQVRSMLSLDAQRYPIVPVQSAFNTMVLANSAAADRLAASTTAPATRTTTATTTETPQPNRPFRGRQRFRGMKSTKLVRTATSTKSFTEHYEPSTTERMIIKPPPTMPTFHRRAGQVPIARHQRLQQQQSAESPQGNAETTQQTQSDFLASFGNLIRMPLWRQPAAAVDANKNGRIVGAHVAVSVREGNRS